MIARRLAGFEEAALTASRIGPYDIMPGWNPIPAADVEGLSIHRLDFVGSDP